MSLLRKTYYQVKPYLPLPIRLAARRRLASHILSRSRDIWPIKRAARAQPADWPGWPNGKTFAVILTHDVEGLRGLDRCMRLADLEESLGFRSSFNFIPEGDYSVPDELRRELTQRGFEVGVHDLYHDGKLYASRAEFQRLAGKINQYLRSWNAAGFRSGFMHHNLEWMHELEIEYDMSTFDTDPFEPQPDGVDTIFPFWVSRPVPGAELDSSLSLRKVKDLGQNAQAETSRNGYVELPYTLPQDSTLFFLLEERGIDIWKRKLDWIARNGGMALLNVHPDYASFDGKRNEREYPVELYSELLNHLRDKHEDAAWLALPSDVARYCARFEPKKPVLSRKRISMVTYSFYESDNRVMRYAEALANRGDSVDVIALANGEKAARTEVMEGVNVCRIQQRKRNEKSKFSYLARIFRFLMASSIVLSWRQLKRPYDVIHVHNVPDFLVFAAWLPKLMGARIILDIHDILPEFFASKFKSDNSDWYVRRLLQVERASCDFADHVIISNHLWHQTMVKRSVDPRKASVILNHVDDEVFYRRTRSREDDRIIAIFPGGLQHHQGLDIAIRAFSKVVERYPTAEFHIYGDGNMKGEWIALAESLGLGKRVLFFKPLPIREIAERIANADIGLVPKRADSFGNEAYSTKIMEFMSQGIPVVAARTKIDTYYFNEELITFFESGNPDDMAEKILRVLEKPAATRKLVTNGLAYVSRNNWSARKQDYFDVVDNMVRKPGNGGFGTERREETPQRDLVSA